MSTVTNDRVERHLKKAVNDMVPNRAEALWHQPVERADETAWYLDGTASRRRTAIKALRPALAAWPTFWSTCAFRRQSISTSTPA
jgi:hypothetical protein